MDGRVARGWAGAPGRERSGNRRGLMSPLLVRVWLNSVCFVVGTESRCGRGCLGPGWGRLELGTRRHPYPGGDDPNPLADQPNQKRHPAVGRTERAQVDQSVIVIRRHLPCPGHMSSVRATATSLRHRSHPARHRPPRPPCSVTSLASGRPPGRHRARRPTQHSRPAARKAPVACTQRASLARVRLAAPTMTPSTRCPLSLNGSDRGRLRLEERDDEDLATAPGATNRELMAPGLLAPHMLCPTTSPESAFGLHKRRAPDSRHQAGPPEKIRVMEIRRTTMRAALAHAHCSPAFLGGGHDGRAAGTVS